MVNNLILVDQRLSKASVDTRGFMESEFLSPFVRDGNVAAQDFVCMPIGSLRVD